MEPHPGSSMHLVGAFMGPPDPRTTHKAEGKRQLLLHLLRNSAWADCKAGNKLFVPTGQGTIDPTPSRRFSSAGGPNLGLFPLCHDNSCRNIIISKSFASPLTTCIEMWQWVWMLLGADMNRQKAWLHKPHFLRKSSGNVCIVYIQHNVVCVCHITLKVVVVIICSIVVLHLI